MKYLQPHESYIVSENVLKLKNEEDIPYLLVQIPVKLSLDEIRQMNIELLYDDPTDAIDNDYVDFMCDQLKDIETILIVASPRAQK